jgi:hypothetical protein
MSNLIKPPFGRHPKATPLRKDLVLDLPMLGVGDLEDYSGNKNDGTNSGATWVAGQYGDALHFADNQDVLIQNSSSINFGTGDITFVFRLRMDAVTGAEFARTVAFKRNPTGGGWELVVITSTGLVRLNIGQPGVSGSRTFRDNLTSLDDGKEHTVIVRWINATGEIDFCLDGVLDNGAYGNQNGDGQNVDNDHDLNIGFELDNTRRPLMGYISYFNMRSKAFTDSEAQQTTDFPWEAYQQDNLILWGGAQAPPVAGGVNLITGLLEQPSKLIA